MLTQIGTQRNFLLLNIHPGMKAFGAAMSRAKLDYSIESRVYRDADDIERTQRKGGGEGKSRGELVSPNDLLVALLWALPDPI